VLTPTTKPSSVAQSVAQSWTKRLPDFSTTPWSPDVVASSQNLAAIREGALMKKGSKIGAQRVMPGILGTYSQIRRTAAMSARRAAMSAARRPITPSGSRAASGARAPRPAS
jgi:hypothetical protein